jgi:N-acetylmuramic acid 6-phosphate etherase
MNDALGSLETEGRTAALSDLDQRPTAEIVGALVRGNRDVVAAVEAAEPAIARLVDAAAERLEAGGRVFYAGAGSAGWLAFVDAMEWAPTFSVPATALVAGAGHPPGSPAEAAAEGDEGAGAAAVGALDPRPQDVLVVVSASGRTPYALGALGAANHALTGAVVCARDSELARRADIAVEVPVGPEVISGSTRLKAGTAQKLVLNAFSTALMVRRGRTLGDLMTSMHVANSKLRDRATRICQAATGCD